jgi:hypothetical protein
MEGALFASLVSGFINGDGSGDLEASEWGATCCAVVFGEGLFCAIQSD